MRKEQIAIVAFAVWLTIISIFMLLAQSFDFDIFFFLSFIGFLIIVELIRLNYIQPVNQRYIWYLIAVAIVILGAIIVLKVVENLGYEFVFP